jgi:V-type H+-transporting ATPase subunit a
MINNFLGGGWPNAPYDNFVPPASPTYNEPFFIPGQRPISLILIFCIVVCVPIMLCFKPCYLNCTHKEDHQPAEFDRVEPIEGNEEDQLIRSSKVKDEDSKADIRQYEDLLNQEMSKEAHHVGSELYIHQMIETIEFVLGTVSNTASYLRLWALSLAHSQLAGVFLENGLKMAWKSNDASWIALTATSFLFWFAFMTATFGILMCMDVLECFLHTLRLHWVEFQNKFFQGAGYLYIPFSFKTVFEKEKNRA